MTLFLTSSPTGDLDGAYTCQGIDSRNGFREKLQQEWKENSRCLIITAFPDDIEASEEMTAFFHNAVLASDLSVSCFDLWDCRTSPETAKSLCNYDVVFLGGGHVPTENAFFRRLKLREEFRKFDGIVIGISAGTMNCADLVYAEPEEPGEATDPAYQRWIPGLNLTKFNILPHHQLVRYAERDGLRLFEDIVFPDSLGKRFLSIPDGSYVIQKGTSIQIFGEAYEICDGRMKQL